MTLVLHRDVRGASRDGSHPIKLVKDGLDNLASEGPRLSVLASACIDNLKMKCRNECVHFVDELLGLTKTSQGDTLGLITVRSVVEALPDCHVGPGKCLL